MTLHCTTPLAPARRFLVLQGIRFKQHKLFLFTVGKRGFKQLRFSLQEKNRRRSLSLYALSSSRELYNPWTGSDEFCLCVGVYYSCSFSFPCSLWSCIPLQKPRMGFSVTTDAGFLIGRGMVLRRKVLVHWVLPNEHWLASAQRARLELRRDYIQSISN